MRKIGKFEILRPFVSNPSLPLFEARGGGQERCVVLLLPRLPEVGAAQVVPFLDGTPRIAALRHPNIARTYDLGMEDGQPYLVGEPVQGIPMEEITRSGASRSARWKVHVVSQVCEALAHAHSQDVLHLDLRPGNVFVTPGGDVKVLGFGVAPLCTAAVGRSVVDLPYAAPEQIAGGRVDHRADIFSVGALACELFAGRPFHQQPDPASIPQTEYSPRLEAIIRKALAQNPDDRPRCMPEMRKAIDALVYDSADAFFDRMLQIDIQPARPPGPPVTPATAAGDDARNGSRPDQVQLLYNTVISQAAEGRLQEASKLAKAIRRLAPGDPRNEEIRTYLLVEAETAVKAALASSPSGPHARALQQRLERLKVAHGDAERAVRRPEPRTVAGQQSLSALHEPGARLETRAVGR